MTAHAEKLRYHRLDTARDSDGWTPEMVRDLGDETFDGMVHATGPLPVVLGLLCEAMPTAAEDAAFAGETVESLCCECDQPIAPDEFWCDSCTSRWRSNRRDPRNTIIKVQP